MKRYQNGYQDTVEHDGFVGLKRDENGPLVAYADHLAAMQKLTDLLAQVERERDELKRCVSCDGCKHHSTDHSYHCSGYDRCARMLPMLHDHYEPRDPSSAQGEKNG